MAQTLCRCLLSTLGARVLLAFQPCAGDSCTATRMPQVCWGHIVTVSYCAVVFAGPHSVLVDQQCFLIFQVSFNITVTFLIQFSSIKSTSSGWNIFLLLHTCATTPAADGKTREAGAETVAKAISHRSWLTGERGADDSKFLFDFPSHQGKLLLPQLQKAVFHQAWLSASITAMSPGQRCLACPGMLAARTLDLRWWQGPSRQLLRGGVGSAAQHDLHGRWWDMQLGRCTAWWRTRRLAAKRSVCDHMSSELKVIHIASDQTSLQGVCVIFGCFGKYHRHLPSEVAARFFSWY